MICAFVFAISTNIMTRVIWCVALRFTLTHIIRTQIALLSTLLLRFVILQFIQFICELIVNCEDTLYILDKLVLVQLRYVRTRTFAVLQLISAFAVTMTCYNVVVVVVSAPL